MIDVSIIIVNWNTRDLLAGCLASIEQYPPHAAFEVFVVDNASSDGSAAMVRQRFPQVHLIENHENVGFARANNQGIRQSSGQQILLLNSDTIVQKSALRALPSFMCTHPRAGIVGALLLNPDGTDQYCFGPLPTLASEIASVWGLDSRPPLCWWLRPHVGSKTDGIRTGRVLGAAMLIRRSALDNVGLLDEDFFMYSEEVDLERRFCQAGWETYILQSARVVHLGQQSSSKVPATMKAQLFHSKVLYFHKHYGRAAAGVLSLAIRAGFSARCGKYRLLGPASQYATWAEAWRRYTQLSQS